VNGVGIGEKKLEFLATKPESLLPVMDRKNIRFHGEPHGRSGKGSRDRKISNFRTRIDFDFTRTNVGASKQNQPGSESFQAERIVRAHGAARPLA